MTGSKLLKFATWGVLAPLIVAFLVSLRTGGLERAVLIGFCVAPTALTFHFAQWIERVERTRRIRFLPLDRGLLLRVRIGIACSLLALTWSAGASFAAPVSPAFDLRIIALVLTPMIVSLGLASRAIDSAVERVDALAEAA